MKYVPIDATKKTGKKTRLMVNFIFSMALKLDDLPYNMEIIRKLKITLLT